MHARGRQLRFGIITASAVVAVVAAVVLATVAPSTVGGGPAGGSQPWAGRTIALGAIFSTTGAGTGYGPQQVQGARLAVRQINAAGGVRGAQLRLDIVNDGSEPAAAADRMRALITSGGVLAVLGPTFSNAAASADPVADNLATPVLAVSNTGPGIVGSCSYPCDWVFRDSLGEASGLPANIGTYAQSGHPARAAVLYPSGDPFGASTAKIAQDTLTADGVSVVAPVLIATPDHPEDAVRTALATNPDAVVVTASSATVAGSVVKELRNDGFRGQILGGNAFNSPLASSTAGSAGNGAQSAAGWFLGNSSAVNRAFVAAYRARYGHSPDQFAALAYTGVKLLASAAASAPLQLSPASRQQDRTALRDALADVQLQTPLGPFRFTADHDVYQPIWVVAMDGRGGFRLIRELPASASLPPS